MPHLHEDVTLDLPIAKYRDSVIIWEDGLLIEVVINRVVSVIDAEGKMTWVYYDTDLDGVASALLEGDILMNLTTGRNFIKERADEIDRQLESNQAEPQMQEDLMPFVELG